MFCVIGLFHRHFKRETHGIKATYRLSTGTKVAYGIAIVYYLFGIYIPKPFSFAIVSAVIAAAYLGFVSALLVDNHVNGE